MKNIAALIMIVFLTQVYGCGGGGSGGGNGGGNGGTPQPTTATLKLSAVGTLPAGKSIAGYDVTIELPTGVTVKTGSGGEVDSTVVLQSGLLSGSNGTMGPVTNTPATATSKAKLDFSIASTAAAGVGAGEFATITFILNGVSPASSDFNATRFKPYDLSYAELANLTAGKALVLK